jgi:nitric oxide reductase subunit C
MTKEQSKKFFIGSVVICFLIFFGLSTHSVYVMPDRTNQSEMTPEVVKGHDLFMKKNCVNCHTILGEGAYYGPELKQVFENKGPEFLVDFLMNPVDTWYGSAEAAKGKRKMPNFGFTEEEAKSLVAFLEWVGRIDTNGWPPEPKEL